MDGHSASAAQWRWRSLVTEYLTVFLIKNDGHHPERRHFELRLVEGMIAGVRQEDEMVLSVMEVGRYRGLNGVLGIGKEEARFVRVGRVLDRNAALVRNSLNEASGGRSVGVDFHGEDHSIARSARARGDVAALVAKSRRHLSDAPSEIKATVRVVCRGSCGGEGALGLFVFHLGGLANSVFGHDANGTCRRLRIVRADRSRLRSVPSLSPKRRALPSSLQNLAPLLSMLLSLLTDVRSIRVSAITADPFLFIAVVEAALTDTQIVLLAKQRSADIRRADQIISTTGMAHTISCNTGSSGAVHALR